MILSLQGCMAVGKTTAINYLKEHAKYVHISYEENKGVVEEIKSRGLDKNKYEDYGMVGNNTIGVAMGTYKDQDGFINDTCCEIVVRAKPFYDKAPQLKEDGKLSREITNYNLDIKMDNFKNGVEE